MPGTPTTPNTSNARSSRSTWHVPLPVSSHVRRPQNAVSTVLCIVNTPPSGQRAPVTLSTFEPQPAAASRVVAGSSGQRVPHQDVRPDFEATEEDNGWGSDFDDVSYTPQERAAFDARFEREEKQIREAQEHWWPKSDTSGQQRPRSRSPR